MPYLPISDFVYSKKIHEGVKSIEMDKVMILMKDLDFSEPKPVQLNEEFYHTNFPGLPDQAYFALALTTQGKKSKEIRSLWKKDRKSVV